MTKQNYSISFSIQPVFMIEFLSSEQSSFLKCGIKKRLKQLQIVNKIKSSKYFSSKNQTF